MANPTDEQDDAVFVDLLSKNQLRLRAYVYSLVRSNSDADDVLQQTCMALWKKRAKYDANRDFFHWACGFALIEVLRYRRETNASKLLFGENVLKMLAAEYLERASEFDRRREMLAHCVEKLKEHDRWLLETHYRSGITISDIAKQLRRAPSTIYGALARIREALYRCVQASIAQDSHR